jgi:UDP-N-acetylglucosamine acyltransferase
MNNVSKFANLIGDVRMGDGNFVSPGALIVGPIKIGNDNFFGPNSVIGMPPQDDVLTLDDHASISGGFGKEETSIEIGNGNVFREFSTIHQGLTSKTKVENNCYVMSYAHIAHDCKIFSGVKIANSVQMGGYSTILRGSYLGLGAILHQFSIIGAFSMIGMGSLVTRNCLPGTLSIGSPAKALRLNKIALQKIGIDDFAWESGYLQDPIHETIHKLLLPDFEDYLITVKNRNLEREQISNFRKAKALSTSIATQHD